MIYKHANQISLGVYSFGAIQVSLHDEAKKKRTILKSFGTGSFFCIIF